MLTLFALCSLVLGASAENIRFASAPAQQDSKVAQKASADDEVEMEPPMEAYESVDLDVDEEADENGRFHERALQEHPALVHPPGPGAQHARKSQKKVKKIANPKKDPHPMDTLHQEMQAFHNSGISKHAKATASENALRQDMQAFHSNRIRGFEGDKASAQAPKPKPVVEQADHQSAKSQAPKIKPAGVAHAESKPVIKQAEASPAAQVQRQVSHQVPQKVDNAPTRQMSHKVDNAGTARGKVAAEAPIAKATVEKLAQALAPPKPREAEPKPDMEFEPAKVHHKENGKSKKHHHEAENSPGKRILPKEVSTTTAAPQAPKHPSLQSQMGELDADLENTKRIVPVSASVEANLEAKLDTKAADEASVLKPFVPEQHGKHKHGKKKGNANKAQSTPPVKKEDPLSQLHDDVHQKAAPSDAVQPPPVAASEPEMAEPKENGEDKLRSDTSGNTRTAVSKKLAKELEHAFTPSQPKPVQESVVKAAEAPHHHNHGKHHKKHDKAPGGHRNATRLPGEDAMGALHRDAREIVNKDEPQTKAAEAVAPVKTANSPAPKKAAPVASPEDKLRKDLGIKNESPPSWQNQVKATSAPAQAHVAPPATHNLIHKSHKHHKGKKAFGVPNVTYKDPMASVHQDAAVAAGKVTARNASLPVAQLNKTKLVPVSKNAITPSTPEHLAKLDKALGVNTSKEVQKPLGSVLSHLGHAMNDVDTLLHGKHHKFLRKSDKKKKKEVEPLEPEGPTPPPPYNVSLMRHALQHLDHAMKSDARTHELPARGYKFHAVIDPDRPEGYPQL